MPKWTKRTQGTRDPNTTTEEENRGRSMKLELMKTPIVMKLVLSQLFCRHHLIGMTNHQTQE